MNIEQATEANIAREPHLEDAWRFLELLDGHAESFVFQTFDDTARKSRSLGKTMFSSLDACADPLRRLQEAGAGVFVTINATVGGRRQAQYVQRVRAVFADLDGAPIEPVLACDLEPHVVVESSPGKFHAYWLCEDVSLDQFAPIQKAIAARFGSDPKVHDLPRVMRMPGFWHQKAGPFLSRIAQVNERMHYHVRELLAEFPPAASKPANGLDRDGDTQSMSDLVRDVTTAENYHDALRNLAWRYLAGGMDPKDAERTLRGLMDASAAPRDDRFEARYNDIPRAVESAQRKLAGMGVSDLSDDALALEMGRDWESDSRYCADWGKWIFWRGDRWEVDRTKHHLTRSRAWLRARAASIVEARPSMVKKAAALRDDKTIYAIDRLITSNAELACTSDIWDTDPMLLGGPKTVDLRTGEARDPRPQDFILKRAACAPAPEGTAAPMWGEFLDLVFQGDAELISYVQRVCGYALTGLASEHVIIFCWGTGRNGKTTLWNVVKALMGDYAHVAAPELLLMTGSDRHPTDMAALRGARLVVMSELSKGQVWNEARLNRLTGGDPITARFMRQDEFTFMPSHTLVMFGNHKPGLRAITVAARERMHLVPFTYEIPRAKRVPDFDKILVEREGPAILRRMIDGCLAWQERGLDPPKIVRAATADYLASEDSFALWLESCTTQDRTAWEPAAKLWDSWRLWAGNAGEVVGSQKAFANMLVEHGFVPHRKDQGRGYYGARLNTSEIAES